MSRGSCGPTTMAATWTERSTTPTTPSDDRRYERLFARLTEYPVMRQSPRPPPSPRPPTPTAQHVAPTCASCDWLGYQGWLSPRDRPRVAANPELYCFSRAAHTDHVSRLPLIARGSRLCCKVLALRRSRRSRPCAIHSDRRASRRTSQAAR